MDVWPGPEGLRGTRRPALCATRWWRRQSRILWQGNLGRIPGIAGMSTDQREAAVRALVTARTNQPFRDLAPGHRGPDLVPTSRFDEFDAFAANDLMDEALADLVAESALAY